MKRFELDAEQQKNLEQAFLSPAVQDGMVEKYESINEKFFQTAKFLYALTKKCPEQTIALRKLQEAQHWFNEAIKKHGAE